MATTTREPFSLTIVGFAEIPHHAERAKLNVTVSSTGFNKASVSDEVVTTTQHIEALLKEYAPSDGSAEAKQAAPLAHWSKTSLSSNSFIPYKAQKTASGVVRQNHTATIRFDIRFKTSTGMAALGAFGVRLTALPHVQIQNLEWMLTAATEKSFRSTLRRAAAQDALAKAQDYCDVFACGNLRPVLLEEGRAGWAMRGGMMGGGHHATQVSYQQMQSQAHQAGQMSQQAPSSASVSDQDIDLSSDRGLDFKPEELRMNMEVTVKFQADPTSAPNRTVPVKRVRSDDEEMADHSSTTATPSGS